MATITKDIVLGNMLKEVTPLPLHNTVVQRSELYDLFAQNTRTITSAEGQRIRLSIMFGAPEGTGSRDELGNLPVAQNPAYESAIVRLKKNFQTVMTSWNAIENAASSRTAFATFTEGVLNQAAASLTDAHDRQAAGYGAGVLCRITSISGTTINIDRGFGLTDGGPGWQSGIRRGMSIVASANVDGSAIRNGGTPAKVLTLNPAANSGNGAIVVDAVPSEWAANDFIAIGDAYGNDFPVNGAETQMVGISGSVDDGTILGTYENISRTTYAEWRATRIDGSAGPYSGNVTAALLMRIHDDARIFGMGRIDTMVTTPALYRSAYVALGAGAAGLPQNPQAGALQAGPKGIVAQSFGTGPVTLRSVVKLPAGRIYGLDSSTHGRIGTKFTAEWDMSDGRMWKQVTVGGVVKDQWYAFLRSYGELFCEDPRKNVVVTGLSTTAA